MAQKKFHDRHTQERNFECGQEVMVRNWREGPKWVQGTVLKKLSPVTYEVKVMGNTWRRHINQMFRFNGSAQNDDSNMLEDNGPCGPTELPGEGSGVETLPDDGSETWESTPLEATDSSSEGTAVPVDSLNVPETLDVARPYPSRNRQASSRWDPSFK